MSAETEKEWPWEVFFLAFASAAISLFLSHRMLGAMPHISDEVSYAFQGRILASGHLWLTAPAVPQAFEVSHILFQGNRWSSVYTPGWPLLLALGWTFRAISLVNPTLLAISVLGIWKLALQLFDRQTAFLAVFVFCISPFVLLMSAGFMSHPATLCACVWSLVFLSGADVSSANAVRRGGRTTGQSKSAVIACALGGFAFITRPYTAVLLLAPAFLWSILRRRSLKHAVLIGLGLFPLGIFYLIYNRVLFSNFLKAGYAYDPLWKFQGPETSLFFSKLQWFFQNMNRSLWGLPFPDLLLLVPLLIPRRASRSEWVLLLCCFALLIGYCFYYYSDIVYSGPRFIYESMGFISILVARSILRIHALLQHAPRPARVIALLGGCSLLIFPIAMRLPEQIRYHSQLYHGQDPNLIHKVNACRVGENALVLLAGHDYILRSFFFQNALHPKDGARVFARDVAAEESNLLKAYPRKEVWRVRIELSPLPGPNLYTDHWTLSHFDCQRLGDKISP